MTRNESAFEFGADDDTQLHCNGLSHCSGILGSFRESLAVSGFVTRKESSFEFGAADDDVTSNPLCSKRVLSDECILPSEHFTVSVCQRVAKETARLKSSCDACFEVPGLTESKALTVATYGYIKAKRDYIRL